MLWAAIWVCVPKIISVFWQALWWNQLLRKIGIKSHFLRALSHDNDVKSHLNGQRVNPYDIIFPHAQYYDAHKTNEKIRFFMLLLLPLPELIVIQIKQLKISLVSNKTRNGYLNMYDVWAWVEAVMTSNHQFFWYKQKVWKTYIHTTLRTNRKKSRQTKK